MCSQDGSGNSTRELEERNLSLARDRTAAAKVHGKVVPTALVRDE